VTDNLDRLRPFLRELTKLCSADAGEGEICEQGTRWLSDLVSIDDWLPPEFAEPDPAQYRQYLLYCDPLERFSVVSFVWGPGQRRPCTIIRFGA
jgi:3-mercaptopropionate dioxygenase